MPGNGSLFFLICTWKNCGHTQLPGRHLCCVVLSLRSCSSVVFVSCGCVWCWPHRVRLPFMDWVLRLFLVVLCLKFAYSCLFTFIYYVFQPVSWPSLIVCLIPCQDCPLEFCPFICQLAFLSLSQYFQVLVCLAVCLCLYLHFWVLSRRLSLPSICLYFCLSVSQLVGWPLCLFCMFSLFTLSVNNPFTFSWIYFAYLW